MLLLNLISVYYRKHIWDLNKKSDMEFEVTLIRLLKSHVLYHFSPPKPHIGWKSNYSNQRHLFFGNFWEITQRPLQSWTLEYSSHSMFPSLWNCSNFVNQSPPPLFLGQISVFSLRNPYFVLVHSLKWPQNRLAIHIRGSINTPFDSRVLFVYSQCVSDQDTCIYN